MVKKIDLNEVERNLFRDYMQDGLMEMLLGAFFFFLGLLLPRGGLVAWVVLLIVFSPALVLRLKKRFTYPRAGYVELRQGDPGPIPWFTLGSFALGLVALIIVWIAAGVIADPGRWYRWMPVFFGIWMAGIFLGLGLQVRLVRYYLVAGVALAAGPLATLPALGDKLANVGLFFATLGAALLACGVFAFVRFLRRNPLPAKGNADASD